ncbi:hypothetical protein A3D55_00110 [Candidatus Jorgensenbacteria bacterium RIFCSPHIGHO2_02_FULL_45_20]|nr:MAG: hypothetical protein A3D55_00110 [Candidatus Jorgensenbacteria bacterium RIFCSPHIGHO2_02_FULL_45_20]
MKNIQSALSALACLSFAFLFQESRFLEFAGVNPNLVLVALLLYSVYRVPSLVSSIMTAAGLFIFAGSPPAVFWTASAAVVFLASSILKNFFLGNRILDFLVSTALGTVLFYFLSGLLFNVSEFGISFSYFNFPLSSFIFKEIAYNCAIALAAGWFFEKTFRPRQ